MKMEMPDLVDRRRYRRNREPEDVERDQFGRVSELKIPPSEVWSHEEYDAFTIELRKKSPWLGWISTADGQILSPTSALRRPVLRASTPLITIETETNCLQRKWPEERIPIDLEPIPGFNLRAQVVGPGGENVKYIQQETHAKVQIKGFGSGFKEFDTGMESNEPMYLHITYVNPDPHL